MKGHQVYITNIILPIVKIEVEKVIKCKTRKSLKGIHVAYQTIGRKENITDRFKIERPFNCFTNN